MYLIVIGWAYIVLLMAATEATSSTGSLLGAFITLLLYGVLPIGLVIYIFGTPARRRALREAQAPEELAGDGVDPDAGGHTPADPVAPVAEEALRVVERAPRQ